MAMHLYCRKVLIKEQCQEIIPSYLRFVKGIVDCEDLPLNISRETYQDSVLMSKLRNVVTRRILKFIDDERKRDKMEYARWYKEFSQFIKEGILTDQENQEQLLRLMIYHTSMEDENTTVSLDEYVKSMKEGQKKIYYLDGVTRNLIWQNPYMAPFKDSDVPVLVLGQNMDEMIFQ